MADDLTEIPLSGGRTTTGVVRVGNTVRKPATASSEFVRSVLAHLTSQGFECSPDFLGTDERGRDVFTFIEGDVPAELAYFDDSTLRVAASVIRRFHDLSRDLVASPTTTAADIEIVCHNDLSPCNFVFRDNRPIAIIDFDASAPGSRAHDLGYAAWLWLDIGSPDISALVQQRRLATFLEAYGATSRDSVLEAMLKRQITLAEQGQRSRDQALATWASNCNRWTRENLPILRRAS